MNTWLAASVAMTLTAGLGARFLTDDDTAAASPNPNSVDVASVAAAAGSDVAYLAEESVEDRWTMPGITVVMQVPEKSERRTFLASSAEESVEDRWTMPGITVVMQVPAKSEPKTFLASSVEETLSDSEPAPEQAVEDVWTMPGITVAMQVPNEAERAEFTGRFASKPIRPASVPRWNAEDGRSWSPARHVRDQRRQNNDRTFDRFLSRKDWRS